MKIRLTENKLKNIIRNVISEAIGRKQLPETPRKVINTINKINQEVEKQKQYMGEELCLIDSNDDEYGLLPITINKKGEVHIEWITMEPIAWKFERKKVDYDIMIFYYDEEEHKYVEDLDEFNFYMNHIRRDLKRGLRRYQNDDDDF